ncbi:cytochrome P450 3A40-like [Dermacentor andersoni]|uniref:cytochrome P450 3A40-like n=1 Tax=Dermacentor andersoni TaxID=34620 RepID=UPI003B3B7EE0
MLLQAAFILVVCSVFVWVIRRRHRHGLFERLGVPGPKPDLLWGNWKQLKKDRIRVMDQWIQHYGKVFGIYLGDKPFMVITDVELIKECFSKAAKVFQDRPTYTINVDPFKCGLPFIRGVIIDRDPSWSPHCIYLKWRLIMIVHITRFLCGKTWGTSVWSMLLLYRAMFKDFLKGLLRLMKKTGLEKRL